MDTLVVTGDLTSYLANIGRIPMLSAEEEIALAKRVLHDNDLEAAQKMIMAHLKFVVYVAKKYKNYGLPLEDLIQEGNIGLMKAVQKFDSSRGFRLATYAIHYIKEGILTYIVKNWKIAKIATTKSQRKLFYNLRKLSKSIGYSTETERNAIAKELKVSVAEVHEMESRMRSPILSYDSHDDGQNSQDDSIPTALDPEQYLYDKNANPEEIVAGEEYGQFIRNKIMKAIDTLSERERDIILSRKFMDKPITCKELAEKYSISAQRVEQLERKIINQLKIAVKEI